MSERYLHDLEREFMQQYQAVEAGVSDINILSDMVIHARHQPS